MELEVELLDLLGARFGPKDVPVLGERERFGAERFLELRLTAELRRQLSDPLVSRMLAEAEAAINSATLEDRITR